VNLGDNAIKYTPRGTPVRIEARSEPEALVLTVHDDGPGIPAPDLERLFDRFWRADAPGKTAGAGIGLTISRGLVAAHGGTIEAASRPDAGTTFTVRLPKDGSR
jgi:signal transduction histidine kinase